MIRSRSTIRVRYAETDMMGIAYHGNYLPWFEIGRTDLLRDHGVPYRDLEARGFRLPVLEVGVRYRRPALYDDELCIETTLAERPVLRIRLDYRLLRGEELLATGFTTHAFINPEGQPVRPPPDFVEAMARAFS
ncbi:MAG: acyl-CoA thioesterase [Puniceicoccaceae bacterium]|nr:MAG: acyl-CoA thioesterase [Puniceicoccaceae bacterium]